MFSNAEMLDRMVGSFGTSWWVRSIAKSDGTGFRSTNIPTAAARDCTADVAVELVSNAFTADEPARPMTVCLAEARAWVRVIDDAIGLPAGHSVGRCATSCDPRESGAWTVSAPANVHRGGAGAAEAGRGRPIASTELKAFVTATSRRTPSRRRCPCHSRTPIPPPSRFVVRAHDGWPSLRDAKAVRGGASGPRPGPARGRPGVAGCWSAPGRDFSDPLAHGSIVSNVRKGHRTSEEWGDERPSRKKAIPGPFDRRDGRRGRHGVRRGTGRVRRRGGRRSHHPRAEALVVRLGVQRGLDQRDPGPVCRKPGHVL